VASTSGVQRHRLDTFALTIGLLSIAGSALALASRADAFEVDGLVALATFWVVVGAVGVTKVVHRLLRPPVHEAPTTAAADAPV
jgi:hypothetical protein